MSAEILKSLEATAAEAARINKAISAGVTEELGKIEGVMRATIDPKSLAGRLVEMAFTDGVLLGIKLSQGQRP